MARLYSDEACVERRRRIRVALFAYAYEFEAESMVSDADFDALALRVDTSVGTGHPVLDAWFRQHFQPHTGQWIHAHPELDGIREIYTRLQTTY